MNYLSRRLKRFPEVGLTGFTPQILTTLIVADRWIQNVDIVLVDDKKGLEGKGKEVEKTGVDEKDKDDKNAPWDNAWDNKGKTVQIHSRVHEKQIEGLLRFAEILKWPYMSEMRDYAEDAYGLIRSGSHVEVNVWDWLYGTVLPGKWAAFKIMAALVLCTPSLAKKLGVSKYYDNGVSLPKRSYWRLRTALGRVLGCLPGVTSVCGWIGPCLPIDGPQNKYIRLEARRVAPPKHDDVIRLGGPGPDEGEESIRPGAQDEDFQQWMADINDESRWAVPEPPVRQLSVCSVE